MHKLAGIHKPALVEERIIMSETNLPSLEELIAGNVKRDAAVAELVLRVTALERALIRKNIISKEEINESLIECLTEYGQVIASRRGLTNNEES